MVRECMGSIGIGNGIVLFYGCLLGFEKVIVIVVISMLVIDFDVFDEKFVDIFFVLFVFEE